MYSTTKRHWSHALVWLCWFLALLALAWGGGLPVERLGGLAGSTAMRPLPQADVSAWAVIVVHDPQQGPVFPWLPRGRWRKWALLRYQAARRAYRRAVWAARGARLLLSGALTMATVVDFLTRAQLRRKMGSLPILYGLLEIIQVRQIINRHCPSAAEVDHGTVALVLVLNRLTAPRALYKVADWVAKTVLVTVLGVPAAKFNDDRLGRTLDAIAAHKRDIWLDIVHQALRRFDINLRFLFYDLTAFVMQGAFKQSELVDYGFAHNTPAGKQKVKVGVTATGDGYVPTEYDVVSGRTADLATVQENMERLCRLLERHGYSISDVLIIGDRANLNDELAVVYEAKKLKYLAGLQPQKKAHRELLVAVPEAQFYAHPLTEKSGNEPGYFGLLRLITFQHAGKTVTHRCLIVLSGPMRRAVRQGRARQLQALQADLAAVRTKIGQKRYRSVKEVQARANTCLRRSPVGKLVSAEAYQTDVGQVDLRWRIDRYALWQAMQSDGRYLLVTNDFSLSPRRMLELYRAKDGLEKRFEVAKQAHKVRPIYVHSDERIQAMLLIHMIALLTYSLLERQVRRRGLTLTTRRIIEQLEELAVIETYCWDGSVLYRLTSVDVEQAQLLAVLFEIMAELATPRCLPTLPSAPGQPVGRLLPPPIARPA